MLIPLAPANVRVSPELKASLVPESADKVKEVEILSICPCSESLAEMNDPLISVANWVEDETAPINLPVMFPSTANELISPADPLNIIFFQAIYYNFLLLFNVYKNISITVNVYVSVFFVISICITYSNCCNSCICCYCIIISICTSVIKWPPICCIIKE